jgi:hypothetical protein
LGRSLVLRDLNYQPQSIQSGGPMSISFRVLGTEPTTINEFAVLIYSDYGIRVSVLDLRREGLYDVQLSEAALEVEVCVDALPLVGGDYRLGFYVATPDYSGDYLDIASFSVCSAPKSGGIVPYHDQYRGFIEIDFSLKNGVTESVSM